ncbi:MAG: hypothetical protein GXO58_03285 [Thermodesulfobacteria bacterium]|nr:hypothetical protein [Thermodesulfobacteriota bacterium]
MNLATTKRETPVTAVTKNKRIKLQVQKEYYESKISCLMDMNLPIKLILLACWDAPVERENLTSKKGQQKFIKQCLKYYKKKLKEIEKEEKKLKQ